MQGDDDRHNELDEGVASDENLSTSGTSDDRGLQTAEAIANSRLEDEEVGASDGRAAFKD